MSSSKKKIEKKKFNFRKEDEERPIKRIKPKKMKYRGKNAWLNKELN